MENKEMELTFSDIIRIFKRRKWTFILIFIATIIITLIYLLNFAKPTYQAQQTIEYEGKTSATSSLSQYAGLASIAGISLPSSGGNNSLTTEIERMKSDKVLGQVVDKLDLVKKANQNKSFLAKIRGIEYTRRGFIKSIRDKIEIEPVKETNFVKISYESSNPTQAASIVSLTYQYYLDYEKEYTLGRSSKTINQIESIYTDLEQQFNEINKQVFDYKIENKISDDAIQTDLINYYEETYLKLLKMDQEKQQLEITLQSIEKNLAETSEEMKELMLTASQSNLSNLKNKLINYQIELETLKLNQPNSPRIRELESVITVTENELKQQQNKLLENNMTYLSVTDREKFSQYIQTQTQLELFDVTKQVYQQMLSVIDAEINKKSPVVYQYLQMMKDQKIIESKYNMFYNTLEQERMSQKLYTPKFSMVQAVYQPENPIAPNKKLILAIGGVLGIFLGILGVFVKESSDNTIKDKKEFETLFKTPEITLNSEKEIEKIINKLYQTKNTKIAIIQTSQKIPTNFAEQIYNQIKKITPEYTYTDPTKPQNYEEKIKQFEETKQKTHTITKFTDIDSPEYILYEPSINNNIILIKQKSTTIETIEQIQKSIPNPTYIFIK
jgi:uncharacterized protein involved in exopolysaccharide biosynthesis